MNPLEVFAQKYNMACHKEAMLYLCTKLREKAHEFEPPIGLEALLSVLNTSKRKVSGVGAKASVYVHGNEIEIITRQNSKMEWAANRFSVAHEIGHILLMRSLADNPEAYQNLRSKEYWKDIELLCHYAASEILIPIDDFSQQVLNLEIKDFNLEMIEGLKKRYLVSYSVILKKILDHKFDILIFWKNSEEKGWKIDRSFWNGNYFLPKKMTAERHFFPNVFGFPITLTSSYFEKDTEIKFGKTSYQGESITSVISDNRISLYNSFFDGLNYQKGKVDLVGFTLFKENLSKNS